MCARISAAKARLASTRNLSTVCYWHEQANKKIQGTLHILNDYRSINSIDMLMNNVSIRYQSNMHLTK